MTSNGKAKWMGFTPSTTDDQAKVLFKAKHGYKPFKVIRNQGCCLAGPIGQNGQRPRRPLELLREVEAAQLVLELEGAS